MNQKKDKISNEDAKQLVKSIQNKINQPKADYMDEIKKSYVSASTGNNTANKFLSRTLNT